MKWSLGLGTQVRSIVFCVALVGCSNQPTPQAVTPPPPPAAKALLEDVVKTGELGSAADSIRQALEDLKATDSAKAEKLLSELSDLETTSDPAKLKSKAKAMVDQL